MDEVVMEWIVWPEGANYLLFDGDGESHFSANRPRNKQYGVWDVDGEYFEAVQNEDYCVSRHGRFPLGVYYSRADKYE